SNGGRISAPDENEEKDRCEEDRVAALSADAGATKSGQHQASREGDVKPGDHEEMVKPAAPVPRYHPAVELRRSSEEERGEGAAHVAIERFPSGAGRRERAVEQEVRQRQMRERGPRRPAD